MSNKILDTDNLALRNFKGIWIPRNIYLNKSLNWTDKILLIEIDSLDTGNGCFASNRHFAEFLSITERSVSSAITKLKNQGYITQIQFNGRTRRLKVNMEVLENAGTNQTSCETGNELLYNNTYNNPQNKDKKDKSFLESNSDIMDYNLFNYKKQNKENNNNESPDELDINTEQIDFHNKQVEQKQNTNTLGELIKQTNQLQTQKVKTQETNSNKELNRQIFGYGIILLTEAGYTQKQSRKILGKWLKDSSPQIILNYIKQGIQDKICEPVAWITKQLHKHKEDYKQKQKERELIKEQQIQEKYNNRREKLEQEYLKTHNKDFSLSNIQSNLPPELKSVMDKLNKLNKWGDDGKPIIDDELIRQLTPAENKALGIDGGNKVCH